MTDVQMLLKGICLFCFWEDVYLPLFMFFCKTRKLKREPTALIDRASYFGLPDKDVTIAREYLHYRECCISFEHIVTQLYKYEICIDVNVNVYVKRVAALMSIPVNNYSFLKKLLPNESAFPTGKY